MKMMHEHNVHLLILAVHNILDHDFQLALHEHHNHNTDKCGTTIIRCN